MSPSKPENQPVLFDYQQPSPGENEDQMRVWAALEKVISSQVAEREEGLAEIVGMDILRTSPLAAYILATRLDDQNIDFRNNVVRVLGPLLSGGDKDNVAAKVVSTLKKHLSQMRRRRIFALLQVGEDFPEAQPDVALLLGACPFGGNDLGAIFSDRRLPTSIREQAIKLAGMVGYLETIPRLERLADRLESWIGGQESMSFVDQTNSEETVLLPSIKKALSTLNAK